MVVLAGGIDVDCRTVFEQSLRRLRVDAAFRTGSSTVQTEERLFKTLFRERFFLHLVFFEERIFARPVFVVILEEATFVCQMLLRLVEDLCGVIVASDSL